jgi:hypothetical protein
MAVLPDPIARSACSIPGLGWAAFQKVAQVIRAVLAVVRGDFAQQAAADAVGQLRANVAEAARIGGQKQAFARVHRLPEMQSGFGRRTSFGTHQTAC